MKLSELKILYEVLRGDREQIEGAIKSIHEGDVSIEDFWGGDWFESYNKFYSSEDYVSDFWGNVLRMDDAFYCNGEDAWFSEGDSVTVYEHRSETIYSRRWADGNIDLSIYRGDYYDSDAMEVHDLVYVQDQNEIWLANSAYYHDNDGWYSYPPDEKDTYTRDYHNGGYKSKSFNNKSKYRIGYEIEKDDTGVLESICIDDFESDTHRLWRKEDDSSIRDTNGCRSDGGYELISPTFEFDIKKIFEHIESNEVLVNHINASYTKCCGGHINLSEDNLTGKELFDKIKGYTPLLYSLYYGRINVDYCKGKSNDNLDYDRQKFQAINIHSNRIEIRIISAVKNVENLKWRSELLMMMLKNPTHDVIKAYYNVDTKFTKLLKQIYSDDKLVLLKERFIKYTKEFEGIDINNKKQ